MSSCISVFHRDSSLTTTLPLSHQSAGRLAGLPTGSSVQPPTATARPHFSAGPRAHTTACVVCTQYTPNRDERVPAAAASRLGGAASAWRALTIPLAATRSAQALLVHHPRNAALHAMRLQDLHPRWVNLDLFSSRVPVGGAARAHASRHALPAATLCACVRTPSFPHAVAVPLPRALRL